MPVDRGEIDRQLEELGEGSRWWDQRELRDLPAVLHTDEHILAIARGRIARVRVLRRSWLIVVTDRRLLCMRSGISGWRQVEVSATHITRASLRVGLFKGRVVVAAGGTTYRLLVPRPDAYRLHTALSGLIGAPRRVEGGTGPVKMVRRVIDHVLALPAAAAAPHSLVRLPAERPMRPADDPAIETRFQRLESEIQELRDQVEFLEQLLARRHAQEVARAALADTPASPPREA